MIEPELETERQILATSRTIAVVGLSDKPHRPSHEVAGYLKDEGYRIVPVNPNITEALGERAYPSLRDVPVPIDVVDIFRRARARAPDHRRRDRHGRAGRVDAAGHHPRSGGRPRPGRWITGRDKESLVLCRGLKEKWVTVECLEGLAGVAARLRQPERAARLFGAADNVRQATGLTLNPWEQAEHEREVALVRATLGEIASSAAWAEGGAIALESAIEYALSEEV